MGLVLSSTGLKAYDNVGSGSSTTSFEVDLPPGSGICLVTAEFAFTSESSNTNTSYYLYNGTTSLTVHNVTWTLATTNYYSQRDSAFGTMNYWSQGAAGNTSYSGEAYRVWMWVYNNASGSPEPYEHPYVHGSSIYEQTTGYPAHGLFAGYVEQTVAAITKIKMQPQSQQFEWYRARSYAIADQ